MTSDQLHDALSLLPADLVTSADQLRQKRANPVIHWRRWAALAACLVLTLGCGFAVMRGGLMGKGTRAESTMQMADAAPEEVMAAPMAPEQKETGREIPGEAPAAAQPEPEAPADDHSHEFAPDTNTQPPDTAAGETGTVVLTMDGREMTITGENAAALTALFTALSYQQSRVCTCPAELTAEMPGGNRLEISLSQAFVRCESGQAVLTENQVKIIRAILEAHP